jgi:DNA ligase-1
MIRYFLSKATTGKFRYAVVQSSEEWNDELKGFTIERSYGQVNGKDTIAPLIIVDKAKQKRTFKEQLLLQFNSECKKYLDKGYKETQQHPNLYKPEELSEIYGSVSTNQYGVVKPMLAKQEDKVTNRKIFDKVWYGSRKIDGVRALFYYDGTEVHVASRGGEHYDYSTVHIRKHPKLVEWFTKHPNVILDGELFKAFESLQKISGAARLEKDTDTEWLEYYIYDIVDVTKPFKDRLKDLELLQKDLELTFEPYKEWQEEDLQIQLVPHVRVSGWDNMEQLHNEYVSEGWEGLVIRDPEKVYRPNGRTNDMIKIKHYKDDTFRVIGYELGLRGSEDMVFILETSDGKSFKAKPFGDRLVKEEYVANFEDRYKGHLGDCKFFYYSDDGIPLQPGFIAFRFDLE